MSIPRLSAVFVASIFLLGLENVLCQEIPNEIVLLATYRDFLPVWCLNNADVPNGQATIQNAWNKDSVVLGSGNADACLRYLDVNQGVDNSAYRAALIDGTISGHPDFEAAGSFSNQLNCNDVDPSINLNFPVGSCLFLNSPNTAVIEQSVVSRTLAVGDGGLPLIQYCKDEGPDTRCGFTLNSDNNPQTQTTKEFFDVWYNDDDKFNRRVGQRLVLTPKAGEASTFEFVDSGVDSPDFPDEPNNNLNQFGPLDIFKIGGTREVDIEQVAPDDCPAWPQSSTNADRHGANNVGIRSLSRGFWFTSEIHTTFEFRADEEMTFTFSGDDDFWAFINGQLAVDVGGMHGARSRSIDLNAGADVSIGGVTFADLLGLVDGEVYTLDIYHAERQRAGSNFQLTTSLFAACNVQQIGGQSLDFRTGFDAAGFDERFFTRGVDFVDQRSFQLLKSTDTFAATHVYTRAQENIGAGFEAKFLARIDGDTEGFAFVIQSAGLEDYPVASGRTFNFNIPNSLAVVFDLCATRDESNACASQQLRVHFPEDTNSTNDAEPVKAEEGGTMRVFDRVLRNLKRDEAFPVEIIFFGERPDFLEVYVNNSLYLRQSGFSVVDAIGTAGAHVGFTASTFDLAANIFIEDFSLSIVEVDTRRTKFAEGEEEKNQTVVADGEDVSEGFIIFTEDACTNAFESGSLEGLVDAKYVEQPNEFGFYNSAFDAPEDGRRLQGDGPLIVDALVQDNLDGTYNLQLQTTVSAQYTLVMAFGTEDCTVAFDDNFVVVENNTINVPIPRLEGDLADCSFEPNFNGAILAVPPEIPPTASPIAFEDVDDEFDILPVAASGGGVCFLLVMAVIIFAVYRAKWQRNKDYVDPGNAYKLELNTQMAGGDEYKAVGSAVLQTQKEILALQSVAQQDKREGDIKQLTRENEEMKEIIKAQKQNTDVARMGTSASANPRFKHKKNKNKVEF